MALLTKAQRRIIKEIDEITDELGLDHRALVEEWEGDEFLTIFLRLAERELISAAVVQDYTFFDEMLGSIITKYFFGSPGGAHRGVRGGFRGSTTLSSRSSTSSRSSRSSGTSARYPETSSATSAS